jgi:hypothetical protein
VASSQDVFFQAVASRRIPRIRIAGIVVADDAVLVQQPADDPSSCYAFIGGEYEIGDNVRKPASERIRGRDEREDYRGQIPFLRRKPFPAPGKCHPAGRALFSRDAGSMRRVQPGAAFAAMLVAVGDVRRGRRAASRGSGCGCRRKLFDEAAHRSNFHLETALSVTARGRGFRSNSHRDVPGRLRRARRRPRGSGPRHGGSGARI